MIAARYLPAVAALLALAAVPTIVHTYRGTPPGDGRSTADIPRRLNNLDARDSTHSKEWVFSKYGATDFIERDYGPDLTLFVARSYDAKRLYHHPENGIGHGDGYDRAVVVRSPDRAHVPIFRLEGTGGRLSVYALQYGDEFVADPIQFQLRNALTLLVRPRELMTLFFVRGKPGSGSRRTGASPEALLLAAVDNFAAQGGSPR